VDLPWSRVGEPVGKRSDLGVVGVDSVPADDLGHVLGRQGGQASPLGRPSQHQPFQHRPVQSRDGVGA
jgi:hypothetical protein